MTNFLLNIVFFMTAFMASPIASYAVGNSGIAEKEENREAEIIVDHHSLRVTGASGKVLYIYDVTGICVMTLRIDNNDKRFELNLAKGCYIVKVGRVVRKIYVN